MYTFQCHFYLGESVHIDGDPSIKGTVTAIRFYGVGDTVLADLEVGYMHNGECKSALVEEHRLSKAGVT